MRGPRVTTLVHKGLGNNAYLVELADGRALAVDPPRDLRAVRAWADGAGLRIAYVAAAHLHADFLFGATRPASEQGARVRASASGQRAFEHRGLVDTEDVDLGGLTLRALATPGHTDEHLSFLLLDGARPMGVFPGGSMVVGAAGRTDLPGDARAEEPARAQYASLVRLTSLPDDVAV